MKLLKSVSKFLRKNVFYVALSVIVIGSLTAIFLSPNQGGNIDPDPYTQSESTGKAAEGDNIDETVEEENLVTDEGTDSVQGADVAVDEIVSPDQTVTSEGNVAEESVAPGSKEVVDDSLTSAEGGQVVDKAEAKTEDEVVAETISSTTATSDMSEPFFAEGDTLMWPVEGEIIVPYSDESTKAWFNKPFNQTMRTFGVCIGSATGDSVKAVATAKVVDIIEDASTLSDVMIPNVHTVMILDHGNGYMSYYGFQNGTPDLSLRGQVVEAGDVLGTVGNAAGIFTGQDANIYLQFTKDNKAINPTQYLGQ